MVSQPMTAFLDESGTPDVPLRATSPADYHNALCIGLCFMDQHCWHELKAVYERTKAEFFIRADVEVKWSNLMRHSGPVPHFTDAMTYDFSRLLTERIDAERFKGVVVTVWKDDAYQASPTSARRRTSTTRPSCSRCKRLQNERTTATGQRAVPVPHDRGLEAAAAALREWPCSTRPTRRARPASPRAALACRCIRVLLGGVGRGDPQPRWRPGCLHDIPESN
jgi:hypothetical protein